jgi:hypothetical protein
VSVFGFRLDARCVFGFLHPCCVFGLAPAYTGSFSFECPRLAFGCASPCHCFAAEPFASSAVVPWACVAIVMFAAHG